MLLKNKSNLKNILKNSSSNIICRNIYADNINTDIQAVIVKDEEVCNLDIPKLFTGNINNLSNKDIDGIIINVSEYSKGQIININENYSHLDIIYKVSNVHDIAKIRSLKPDIVIIGSDNIYNNSINPYILKMLIDWDCLFLLNCGNMSISLQHIYEYGFSGIYSESNINIINYNVDENIKPADYLSKLYIKKSSIRPLLKAKNIENQEELDICIKKDIDMVGFLFDKHNKSNIINMLNNMHNKNFVKVLEVYDESLIQDALNIINLGLADCIENNSSKEYIENSFKRHSIINNKSTLLEPLIIENINVLENNIEIHNPLWITYQEDMDIMSIIKIYGVELIEFNIKKYNTEEKISEIIKKIKYKQ